MHSTLSKLEKLVLCEITDVYANNTFSNEILIEWLGIAQAQYVCVEEKLKDYSLKLKPGHFRHFIGCLQTRIIYLADELYKIAIHSQGFYGQLINIHNVLDSLLSFLLIHFPQHLNQDQNIPEKGRVEVYTKFQKLNNSIKKQLQGIDKPLYNLIIKTFEPKNS
ncbi:MAG: hypothetical protein Q8928_17735 [Bacteroidota bacterium]|nr:hypothetical protein [Bacteroidota bacterium]